MYLIEDGPAGPEMLLKGRWSPAAAQAMVERGVQTLILGEAIGSEQTDLNFLEDLPIVDLRIVDRRITDLSPLIGCRLNLRRLLIATGPGPNARIDLSAFPFLEDLEAHWMHIEGSDGAAAYSALSTLSIEGYDEPDLHPLLRTLGVATSLEHLALEGPRLRSLDGLDQVPAIRWLEVRWPMSPDIDANQLATATRLTRLDLPGYKDAFRAIGWLASPAILECLVIEDGGRIPNLQFLRGMDNLQVLLMGGDVNIEDNDLSPLLDLPRLRVLGLRNRRRYSPQLREIEDQLQLDDEVEPDDDWTD